MKILVVGGNGFVGSHLTTYFANKGIQVVSWSSSGEDPQIGSAGQLLAKFPEGVDRVIYLSQSPHYRQTRFLNSHLFRVNSLLPMEVCSAAIAAGVQHFTYFSTGSVYRASSTALLESSALERNTPYALSKIHGEEGLRLMADRIALLVLRPFFIYGKGQRGMLIPKIIERVKEGRPVVIEGLPDEPASDSGGLAFTPIHVEQVSRCVEVLVRNQTVGTFNLAGDDTISVRALALMIASEFGAESKFEISSNFRTGNFVADISHLRSQAGQEANTLGLRLREVIRTFI